MSTNDQELQGAKTAGEAAGLWWVSVLQNPKFDNGANDPIAAILMTSIQARRPPVQTDNYKRFADLLSKKLDQQLAGDPGDYSISTYGVVVQVDYHPDRLLAECAKQADLPVTIGWPWKTHMWVKPDEVSVMYGYGSDLQVIWTKP